MGTTHLGAPGGPGVPWGGVPPRGTAQVLLWPILSVFVHKKIFKKFRGVWTPFDIDFLRCKKQAKNSNSHWINRLVPKNDIKLL